MRIEGRASQAEAYLLDSASQWLAERFNGLPSLIRLLSMNVEGGSVVSESTKADRFTSERHLKTCVTIQKGDDGCRRS